MSSGKDPENARRKRFFQYLLGLFRSLCVSSEHVHGDEFRDLLEAYEVKWPVGISQNIIGSVWTSAASKGWIKKTKIQRKSKLGPRHANETTVWKSLLYDPNEQREQNLFAEEIKALRYEEEEDWDFDDWFDFWRD